MKQTLNVEVKMRTLALSALLSFALIGCDDETGAVNGGQTDAGQAEAGAMNGGAMNGGAMSGGTMYGGAMSGGAMSGGAMNGGEELGPEVTLTVKALNPLSGQGLAELSASLVSSAPEGQASITDMSGEASFSVPAGSSYEVTLDAEGYSTHHLFGELGMSDATQISFVSADTLTRQVFSALGLTPNQETGIVVIGLDRPDLSPAIGTSAELSTDYAEAFVLGNFGPSRGREVITGGGGFVSFANVTPGEVEVLVTPAEGERCAVFPRNESTSFTIPVYAGQVSIVAFTCQAE